MFPFWIEIDAAALAQFVTMIVGGLAVLLSIGAVRGGRL